MPLSVWFTSGETVYRSSSTSTDTTDLVFDPVGSAFSLSGHEIGMGLSIPVAGVRVGFSKNEGRARARLQVQQEGTLISRYAQRRSEPRSQFIGYLRRGFV